MSNWIITGTTFFPTAVNINEHIRQTTVNSVHEFDRVVFFEQAYLEQRNEQDTTAILAYFTSAPSTITGLPWNYNNVLNDQKFIDTVTAISIEKKFKVILVRVELDQYTYEYPNNPWRTHPWIQLKELPSVYRWNKDKFIRSLVGDAYTDRELLSELITNSTSQVTWYKSSDKQDGRTVTWQLNQLQQYYDTEKQLILVYTVLEDDATTGESICPDVRKANPVLYKLLNGLDKPVVVYKVVVSLAEWKQPYAQNVWKQHPLLQLHRIPTLTRLVNNTTSWQLVESSLIDEVKVLSFLHDTRIHTNRNIWFKITKEQSPADFDKLIKQIEDTNQLYHYPVLVIAVSAKEKDLGNGYLEPWCPYVRLGAPVFYDAVSASTQRYIIVEIDVALNGYRDENINQWRKHPLLQLQFVPTLYHWSDSSVVPYSKAVQQKSSGPNRALVGAAVADKKKLNELLQLQGPPIYWHRVLDHEIESDLDNPNNKLGYKLTKHGIERFDFLLNGVDSRLPTLFRTQQRTQEPIFVYPVLPKSFQQDSWCPYVVAANPVLYAAIGKLNQRVHIVEVEVDSAYYKDLSASTGHGSLWRTKVGVELNFVPTLIRWSTETGKPVGTRLEARAIQNVPLIQHALTDRTTSTGPTYWSVLAKDTGKLPQEAILKIAVDRLALRSESRPVLLFLRPASTPVDSSVVKASADQTNRTATHPYIPANLYYSPDGTATKLYEWLAGQNVVVIEIEVVRGEESKWKQHPLVQSDVVPSIHSIQIDSTAAQLTAGNKQLTPGQQVQQPTAHAKRLYTITTIDQTQLKSLLQQHNQSAEKYTGVEESKESKEIEA